MRRPRVQKPSRKWRCPWCRRSENGDLGKVMSSKNVLQKHLASAHSDETILFCPSLDCKAFYEGVEKLTDHMRYHEGDGDRCKRIPCIYTNRDYNKMRAHEDCHKKVRIAVANSESLTSLGRLYILQQEFRFRPRQPVYSGSAMSPSFPWAERHVPTRLECPSTKS